MFGNAAGIAASTRISKKVTNLAHQQNQHLKQYFAGICSLNLAVGKQFRTDIVSMSSVAVADSFDVLGDAKEYQEWLLQQQPSEPPSVDEILPMAMSLQDLPDDIAQAVQSMDQEDAAVVLAAYQNLQQSRYEAVYAHVNGNIEAAGTPYVGQVLLPNTHQRKIV